MTTGNDIVDSSTNINTSSGATISDGSITDSDVLNAKISVNSTPTSITNIETINLDIAGFDLTFDATNVSYGSTSGTTINLSTSQAGNTQARVSGLSTKNVNVKLTSPINELVVTGTANTNDAAKITLAGGVATITETASSGIENLTLASEGSSANVLTLISNSGNGNINTVVGSQNLKIKGAANAATGLNAQQIVKGAGYTKTLELDVTGSASGADLRNAVVDKVILSAAAGNGTVTLANNATLSLNVSSALSGSTVNLAQTVTGTSTGTGTLSTLNIDVDKASGLLGGSTGTIGNNITVLNLRANEVIGSGSGSAGAKTLVFDGLSGASATAVTLNISGTKDVNLITATTNSSGTDKLTVSAAGLQSGSLYLDITGTGAATGTFQAVGSAQADIITVSGTGASTILGGAGDDTITGSATIAATGSDRIFGEAGNDTIVLTAGADTLYGGAGADIFRISSGAGSGNTIKDFVVGTDRLQLLSTGTLLDVTTLFLSSSGTLESSSGTAMAGFSGVVLENSDAVLANAVAGTGDNWSSSIQLGNATTAYTIGTGSGTVKAGSFDDNISLSAATGRAIEGGAGNDTITLTAGASGATVTITGGAGDDVISLLGTSSTGVGRVVFGATAAANGNDTITGFDANTANHADVLSFTNFLGTSGNTVWTGSGGTDASGQSSSGTGVVDFSATGLAGSSSGNDVFVAYSLGKTSLTASDIALSGTSGGKIAVEDNSKAVVVLAVGTAASSVANIYYVENGATTGLSDVTVSLVGSVTFTNSDTIDDLVAANFIVS